MLYIHTRTVGTCGCLRGEERMSETSNGGMSMDPNFPFAVTMFPWIGFLSWSIEDPVTHLFFQ